MEGLKCISIKGESYPVFYGMYGFALIMKKTGLDMNQILEKAAEMTKGNVLTGDNIMFLYELIHAGFATGSLMQNKSFPYNAVQLSAYLPLEGQAIETVFQAFADTMPQATGADQKKTQIAPKRKK